MREPSRIAVSGLGYVGVPLVLALARRFDVVGFDVSGRPDILRRQKKA